MKVLRCVDFKLRTVNCTEKNSKEAAEKATYVNRGQPRIKASLIRGQAEKGPEGHRGPELYLRKYGNYFALNIVESLNYNLLIIHNRFYKIYYYEINDNIYLLIVIMLM